MFNGIVDSIGTIDHVIHENDCLKINIVPTEKYTNLFIGESIAINGVCLTLTDFTEKSFYATVVPETLRVSNLYQLAKGSLVNLERSIKNNMRICGHYVQGHVDGIGEIIEIKKDGDDVWILKVSIAPMLRKYIVRKGYIALDGMSITVIQVTHEWFTVTLIPHTRKVSIANNYTIGTKINIEVDILGKYVENLLRKYDYALAY